KRVGRGWRRVRVINCKRVKIQILKFQIWNLSIKKKMKILNGNLDMKLYVNWLKRRQKEILKLLKGLKVEKLKTEMVVEKDSVKENDNTVKDAEKVVQDTNVASIETVDVKMIDSQTKEERVTVIETVNETVPVKEDVSVKEDVLVSKVAESTMQESTTTEIKSESMKSIGDIPSSSTQIQSNENIAPEKRSREDDELDILTTKKTRSDLNTPELIQEEITKETEGLVEEVNNVTANVNEEVKGNDVSDVVLKDNNVTDNNVNDVDSKDVDLKDADLKDVEEELQLEQVEVEKDEEVDDNIESEDKELEELGEIKDTDDDIKEKPKFTPIEFHEPPQKSPISAGRGRLAQRNRAASSISF
ncbi:hypothetical protein ROZALSC1DRAFT_31219, partial [Rozella allomycis CSF55]